MPRGTDRRDEARLQGRLWTPEQLRASGSLYTWLDAADFSTITIATGVSSWADKSGFGRTPTQSTGSAQPGFSVSAFNGKPGLSFTANTQILNFGSAVYSSYTSGVRWFGIYRVNSNSDGAVFGASGNQLNHHPFSDNIIYDAFLSSARKTTNITIANRPQNVILSIKSAPSNYVLNLNGDVSGSGFYSTSLNTMSTNIVPAVGGSYASTATNAFLGVLAEIVVCGNVAEPIARAVEGYLAWKWLADANPLVASHPFKNRPPLIGD